MADDKNTQEVTETETETTVTETETETTTETAPSQETTIDYEAIATTEEARGKPDPSKAQQAFKERKGKREDEVVEEGGDEDTPITRKDLDTIRARDRQDMQKSFNDSSASQMVTTITGGDAEARAVLATWRNRTFPEGLPLAEQVEEAYAIVNRRKVLAVNKELARALLGKQTTGTGKPSAQRDAPQGGEPRLSAVDKQALAQQGFTYDGTKGLYKKPIGKSGKHVWKNMKTGASWVA